MADAGASADGSEGSEDTSEAVAALTAGEQRQIMEPDFFRRVSRKSCIMRRPALGFLTVRVHL